MARRLDQERQQQLEPIRMQTAIDSITALGYNVEKVSDSKIVFTFNGCVIQYYPYSGWASGKSISDGRGLKKLLNQIALKQ